jgi:hypoxanthine phosphoribosyltransferase
MERRPCFPFLFYMYVPAPNLILPRTRLTLLTQNKNKEKKGRLPEDMLNENRYVAARTVDDVWICYPWEATDIDEHDAMAAKQGSR